MHRIECILRPNNQGHCDFDISDKFSDDPSRGKLWLQDFRFISEIRNKVIEHAPENLTFHSKWGQVFNVDDPYDYRLWILAPNALDILKTDSQVLNEIDSKIAIIRGTPVVNDSLGPFDRWCILNGGARHLSNRQIKELFDNALKKVGCISHLPIELASKLSNSFSFIFK